MESRSPRILFVTRKYPPSVGGMETYSARLYGALVDIGADVDLHSPSPPIMGRPSSLEMLRFLMSASWRLLRHQRKYDAVLLGDYALAGMALIIKIMTRGHTCIVVSMHGNDLYFMRRRTLAAAAYRLVAKIVALTRSVDAAIANSHAIAAEAHSRGIGRTRIVPLATDIPKCVPSIERRPQLLFAGRLIRYKGLSWFVENVWPLLDARYELLVAGPIWDELEYQSICGRERIRYLGVLSQDNLAELRGTVAACIMPNLPPSHAEQDEGFGLVALEAAAMGAPVVASNCGGIPDAVMDGTTGFILTALDVKAWTECLNEIILWTDEDRESFSRGARDHVIHHFNWRLVAQRTMGVVEQATERCAGR